MEIKNIHPIVPEVWAKLQYIQALSIDEFIANYSGLNKQKPKLISNKFLLKAFFNRFLK